MKFVRTDTILDRIVGAKMRKLEDGRKRFNISGIERLAASCLPPRNFHKAVRRLKRVRLIAELKRASPLNGILRANFDVMQLARWYEEAGASAISVVTEEDFFLGAPEYISPVLSVTTVPVLRKDFILERFQVFESRLLGADAVLLIAAILTKPQLKRLISTAEASAMAALVEVHNEEELENAIWAGAQIVGINNRDLRTMRVDFSVTERLFGLVPDGVAVVSESGFSTRDEVMQAEALGVDALLIGGAIVKAKDVKAKICELLGDMK